MQITEGLVVPMQASAALTKFRFVKQTGTQTVAPNAAINTQSMGVVQQDVSAGEAALGKTVPVYTEGIMWVEAGAAISLGARVMSDSSGRAVTLATAGSFPTGLARKAAGGAGELVPVELDCKQAPLP